MTVCADALLQRRAPKTEEFQELKHQLYRLCVYTGCVKELSPLFAMIILYFFFDSELVEVDRKEFAAAIDHMKVLLDRMEVVDLSTLPCFEPDDASTLPIFSNQGYKLVPIEVKAGKKGNVRCFAGPSLLSKGGDCNGTTHFGTLTALKNHQMKYHEEGRRPEWKDDWKYPEQDKEDSPYKDMFEDEKDRVRCR